MIEEKNLTPVGKFQKTHALKGELNAVLDIDDEYFADGHPLVINMEGAFVPFYAESVRGKGSASSLIKLEGIDSSDEARQLVNSIIYADKESLKEYMAEEGEGVFLEDDLVGFRVADENAGNLGVVVRVDTTTSNTLFIVENSEGDEIFIPVADDFILEIDETKREILTHLPEELINLNQKSK